MKSFLNRMITSEVSEIFSLEIRGICVSKIIDKIVRL